MCIYSQTCEAALSLSVSLASSSHSDGLSVHDCMLFIFLLVPLACLFLTLFCLSLFLFLFLSPSLQQNNKSQGNWWRRIREEQELLPGDRRTPARRDQWEERWGAWPEPAEEITHTTHTHTHTEHQSTWNLLCSGSSSGSTTGQTTPSTALRPAPRVCLLVCVCVCVCVCVSCMHYSNPPPVVLFLQEDDISQGSQSRGIR